MSPNATNPVDLPDNSAKVSFSNDIEHAAPVARKTSTELRAAKDRQSLSASAKAWDIDGDGELDEAELALRALDKSHKGTLSKEQMYQLMNQSLTVERELGKVKKVVIGLVVFTCILALANVGTSFAAAYLAKDTTTQEGKLVDSKTGDILATDSTATIFEVDTELSRRRHRALCEQSAVTYGNGNKVASAACTMAAGTIIDDTTMGMNLVQACKDGGSATLSFVYESGTVDHPICAVATGYSASYSGKGNQDHRGILVAEDATGRTKFSIQPDDHDAPTVYTVTGLVSALNQACTLSTDCATGLVCDSGSCKADAGATCTVGGNDCRTHFTCYSTGNQAGDAFCACSANDACSGEGEVCSTDAGCQVMDQLPTCVTQSVLDASCVTNYGQNTCNVVSAIESWCVGSTESTVDPNSGEDTITILAGLNEGCSTTSDCDTNLMCDSGVCKGYNGYACIQGDTTTCATGNPCGVSGPLPPMDGEPGACRCSSSSACPNDSDICAEECPMADGGTKCWPDMATLNAQCVSMGDGTTTCNVFESGGSYCS